jgi:hypothetical protein
MGESNTWAMIAVMNESSDPPLHYGACRESQGEQPGARRRVLAAPWIHGDFCRRVGSGCGSVNGKSKVTPNPHFKELLSLLNRCEAKYLVIGG